MPDIIGEAADRLVTVEMKNRGMPHGIIIPLYDAARKEMKGKPLSACAAEGLVHHVKKKDSVLIVTGAGYPPGMPKGESDGPPGAAAIARAIYWGLGAVPVYLSEERHADPIIASSEAAGIMIRDFKVARDRHMGAVIETAPDDQGLVPAWIRSIFDRYSPKAAIFIEKLGPNEKGVVHNATGQPKDPKESGIIDISGLAVEAAQRGVFTIGVGDHGNEVGFGRIADAVRDVMPHGRRCQCPCGGGMGTAVATDVIFPAVISNWGVYAIEAVLAFLVKDPNVMHSPKLEERIIYACLNAGGLEAMYCSNSFVVDSTQGESSVAVVQLLNDLVRLNLQGPTTGVAH